ncbi:hypothetical protein GGR52DRAFT_449901 [Hypoxylon sp. FL1284]|nr:hypothetical protein GGR52DRAFT_449901 [Hypoxylon sp. FL1284]
MDSTPSQPNPSSGSGLRIPEPGTSSSSAFAPAETGVVDSPVSPASPNALARFEFEAGRGNDGTKVLMVEWDPAPAGAAAREDEASSWTISWEGKQAATTFRVDEKAAADEKEEGVEGEKQRRKRAYFLLSSDAAVPAAVAISHAGSGSASLTAKSMPAIFAPGLGVGSRDAGRRGVLHTVWARLRAGQLQDEIRAELRDNSEGVGLEMAVQERLWIIDHFGLDDLRPPPDVAAANASANAAAAGWPAGSRPPQSPRSPIGGRLGEKLRGLKLATSPLELANPLETGFPQQHASHPLPRPEPPPPDKRGGGGLASLDAVLDGGPQQQQSAAAAAPPATLSKETEDELFALPMSPRSPEMKTSPFSFLK